MVNEESGDINIANIKGSEHFKVRKIENDSEKNKQSEHGENTFELVFDDPRLRFTVPVRIRGFSKTMDVAGNDVLYFKPKDKDKVILIHKTDHPDVNKSVAVLTEWANMNGYTIVDLETHAKELFELIEKQATQGKQED